MHTYRREGRAGRSLCGIERAKTRLRGSILDLEEEESHVTAG